MDGAAQARKIPVPIANPLAARVGLKTDAGEGAHPRLVAVKLSHLRITGARIGFLPNEEDLVDRAQGVELQFIIGVLPGDKQFDIIVLIDQRIPLGQGRLDKGFFDPVPDIETVVIPQNRGARVMNPRLPVDEIRKAGRTGGVLPTRFIQAAINLGRRVRAIGGVVGNGGLRPRKRPGS